MVSADKSSSMHYVHATADAVHVDNLLRYQRISPNLMYHAYLFDCCGLLRTFRPVGKATAPLLCTP